MKITTKELTITAVLAALVFAVTYLIQIPIPVGYFNIGNSIILLGCLLVPMPQGTFAGSIGSALADLVSYPIYTIPTLVIKALMPVVFYLISKIPSKKFRLYIPAVAVSTLIPLVGYTVTGCFISGSLMTGLAQFPGLLIEYVANLVIFILLYRPMLQLSKKLNNI